MVEDNIASLHILAMLLKSEGHTVQFALTGPLALHIAKTFHPDVVLLDLGLPGIDGFEVCRRLRRHPQLQNTRIVAVTAYGDQTTRAKATDAGFDFHITKPYEPDYLLAVVRGESSAPN